MSTSKRKLGFYNCYIHKYENGENDRGIFDKEYFVNLIRFIKNKEDKLKIDEASKKIYLLKNISFLDDNVIKIIFVTGKYGHTPDYLSSVDGTIRETTKQFFEAEEELTHICIKVKAEKAILLLEERQIGVSAKKFIWYLNEMGTFYEGTLPVSQQANYKFFVEDYPVDNVDKIFNDMKEAKTIELYTSENNIKDTIKEWSGIESPLLRDEICVIYKAKPREVIPGINMLRTIKNKFFKGGETESDDNATFSRLRITGKQSDKSPIVFDTEMLRRKKHVETQINERGIVDSVDIFSKMVPLIMEME